MCDRAEHADQVAVDRGDTRVDECWPQVVSRTQVCLWYVVGIASAAVVGCSAAVVNRGGWAPVGVYSLAVGLALGVVLSGVAAMTNTVCRTRLAVGAVVMAIVAVATQHAGLYHEFRQRWHEVRAANSDVAMFRPVAPWSPAEYFARQLSPGRVTLWCIDAVLVVAGALGTIATWRNCAARGSACGIRTESKRACEANHSCR